MNMTGSGEIILQLAWHIGAVYVLLLAIYGLTGTILGAVNRRHPKRKIQKSDCPPERVRADIAQSIRSLLVISVFLGAGLVMQSRGWGWSPPPATPVNVTLSLVASLILFDTWFYWGHRLIHTRPLYRRVHRWHHLTVTPTAWSNNSDTFLDNLVLQSYWLVVIFMIPINPWVLVAHKIFDQITGMVGHAGYEYFAGRAARWPSPMVATIFHDQHHKHFTCNYATHFSFWDRLMGTARRDYDETVKRFEGDETGGAISPP
jgi:sterol desaturase/sphingolipid hydroxylase (fatty acid hydroxylase superfamily)